LCFFFFFFFGGKFLDIITSLGLAPNLGLKLKA